jgi:hypothetical protein
MIHGEGTAIVRGVTPIEVFYFVLDPAQYTKAGTKQDRAGHEARRHARRHERARRRQVPGPPAGVVVTRDRWEPPHHIAVRLEHGAPGSIHPWFETDAVDGGTRIHHVEEIEMGWGPLGALHDLVAGRWFVRSVRQEVNEIARLLEVP